MHASRGQPNAQRPETDDQSESFALLTSARLPYLCQFCHVQVENKSVYVLWQVNPLYPKPRVPKLLLLRASIYKTCLRSSTSSTPPWKPCCLLQIRLPLVPALSRHVSSTIFFQPTPFLHWSVAQKKSNAVCYNANNEALEKTKRSFRQGSHWRPWGDHLQIHTSAARALSDAPSFRMSHDQ